MGPVTNLRESSVAYIAHEIAHSPARISDLTNILLPTRIY